MRELLVLFAIAGCGRINFDPLGDGARSRCIAEMSAVGDQVCVRRSDGSVWCWGDNTFGQLGTGMTGGQSGLMPSLLH